MVQFVLWRKADSYEKAREACIEYDNYWNCLLRRLKKNNQPIRHEASAREWFRKFQTDILEQWTYSAKIKISDIVDIEG